MKSKKLNAAHVCQQFEEGRAPRRKRRSERSAGRMPFGALGKPAPRNTAKNKGIDGVEVWKQYEDFVIPQLKLSLYERVLYTHLVRHSRLEGMKQLRFTIPWLRRGTGFTIKAARKTLRQLRAKKAIRMVECGYEGHLVEVRLPREIRGVRVRKIAPAGAAGRIGTRKLEDVDFLGNGKLRKAIHAREGGRCFYCMRRMGPRTRSLDHVVPRARKGGNTYRNLVSCCEECNSLKADHGAEKFLRWLYRERRIDSAELAARLRALKALASGNLKPKME